MLKLKHMPFHPPDCDKIRTQPRPDIHPNYPTAYTHTPNNNIPPSRSHLRAHLVLLHGDQQEEGVGTGQSRARRSAPLAHQTPVGPLVTHELKDFCALVTDRAVWTGEIYGG